MPSFGLAGRELERALPIRQRGAVYAATAMLLLGFLATLAFSASALAAEPGTLTGEGLFSRPPFPGSSVTATPSCSDSGASRVDFEVSGFAAGVYGGTFTESGTATFSPALNGPLLSFQSSFEILSGSTTITGTKRLIESNGSGFCREVADGYSAAVIGIVEFEATIRTAEATWTERGTASVSLTKTKNGDFTSADFVEQFLQSTREESAPAAVLLTPVAASNEVGTDHTVTATVTTAAGDPVECVTVRFSVSGSVMRTGFCTTDASGRCSFTYRGPDLPGADVISAYADADTDGTRDAEEPEGTATKVWVLPLSTQGRVTGGGKIPFLGADVAFSLHAVGNGDRITGGCTVNDQTRDIKIKCLDVTVLVQTPTRATLFGDATVNGVATTYRIDVDDLGEPGRGSDTFKIQTDAGYSAAGTLSAGNIQIHPR